MANSLKLISARLKSVASIQKITKSMKMVSVAKYARAKRLLRAVRPFGETTTRFFKTIPLPLSEELLLFAITSDRGLCGSCHSNVSKRAVKLLKEQTSKQDIKSVKLVCVGDKARGILHFRFGKDIIMVAKDIGKRPPTFLDASLLAMGVVGTGFVDKSWIVIFNKFKTMISSQTTDIDVSNIPGVLNSPKLLPFDEIEDESVTYYVQFSKASIIYYALVESACSEHAARMTAMETATSNANRMMSKLRLNYNRGRQASITRELIEIISGAAAVKKDD